VGIVDGEDTPNPPQGSIESKLDPPYVHRESVRAHVYSVCDELLQAVGFLRAWRLGGFFDRTNANDISLTHNEQFIFFGGRREGQALLSGKSTWPRNDVLKSPHVSAFALHPPPTLTKYSGYVYTRLT
jgi:hypothetical protein